MLAKYWAAYKKHEYDQWATYICTYIHALRSYIWIWAHVCNILQPWAQIQHFWHLVPYTYKFSRGVLLSIGEQDTCEWLCGYIWNLQGMMAIFDLTSCSCRSSLEPHSGWLTQRVTTLLFTESILHAVMVPISLMWLGKRLDLNNCGIHAQVN